MALLLLALAVAGSFLAANATAQTAATAAIPEIPISCEGFCDLRLAVQERKILPDGTLALRVAATYKHEPVALCITLAPGIVAGFMNAPTGMPDLRSVARGGIHFQSVGAESDRLVMMLAKLFQSKQHPKAMDEDVHFDAYAVQDPKDLQAKEIVFRIFHLAAGTGGQQVEILLDMNLPRNEVRLREVNQDFRDYVVQILSRVPQ